MGESAVTVASGLTALWEVVGSCLQFITTNALLMTMFVASLVVIGFRILRKAKKTASK